MLNTWRLRDLLVCIAIDTRLLAINAPQDPRVFLVHARGTKVEITKCSNLLDCLPMCQMHRLRPRRLNSLLSLSVREFTRCLLLCPKCFLTPVVARGRV
ncbi:Uncharacterised protein [Mycobacteroides abscessus subsp. massiliense]|nr:Uncharacterised protein [Mycobacteroides abscessus subsp. massiliense]